MAEGARSTESGPQTQVGREPAAQPPSSAATMMGELMSLQRLAGNRAVTTLIQRSSAEPEANEFAAQLGTEGELEGAAATSLDIQRKTSPGVTTEVTGTGDDIDRFDMPAAEIAAQHGRPGVVGWTTPAFNISFAGSSPQAIHATTNMRFTMQLAEEYQGSRGRILRDHEQGHTRIGMRRARRHFDEQLHDGIAALPRPFSVDAVRGVQDTAVADFRAGERADSQAYDDRDYPRMERAYHGARASMATLGHDAPVLQRLIDSLRHFKAVPVADIGPAADLVSTRIRACSRHQLETVQYNLEFSGAADAAIQRADHLRGDSTVPETARPNLEAALTLMGSLRHSTSRTVSDVLGDTTH